MTVHFGGRRSVSSWMVSVAGRTYGPYTSAQMQTFAVEGRLTADSLISKEDTGRFGPAAQDPELGHLFQPASLQMPEVQEPTRRPSGARAFGQSETGGTGEPSHFLILADMKSGSTATLEEELFRLGAAYAVMPHAWVLSCDLPIGALRNLLVQKLGKLDTLLVVDATHDKLSWSNLGLEAETRVRGIWAKEPPRAVA